MAPESESENLRILEEHAAEKKAENEKQAEETEETPAAPDEEGSDADYGVENDMRPGGPAAGEAEADGPTKRVDEDVTGDEETEHMSELHTDD